MNDQTRSLFIGFVTLLDPGSVKTIMQSVSLAAPILYGVSSVLQGNYRNVTNIYTVYPQGGIKYALLNAAGCVVLGNNIGVKPCTGLYETLLAGNVGVMSPHLLVHTLDSVADRARALLNAGALAKNATRVPNVVLGDDGSIGFEDTFGNWCWVLQHTLALHDQYVMSDEFGLNRQTLLVALWSPLLTACRNGTIRDWLRDRTFGVAICSFSNSIEDWRYTMHGEYNSANTTTIGKTETTAAYTRSGLAGVASLAALFL